MKCPTIFFKSRFILSQRPVRHAYMRVLNVCFSNSKRTRYCTRKPGLCLCVNWFKVRESCTSISLTSFHGLDRTAKHGSKQLDGNVLWTWGMHGKQDHSISDGWLTWACVLCFPGYHEFQSLHPSLHLILSVEPPQYSAPLQHYRPIMWVRGW